MHLTFLDYARWYFGVALELSVCFLAFRRGLARRLLLFNSYTVLLLVAEAIYWPAYAFGSRSYTLFLIYWALQAILLATRGGIVAEICWRVLRSYPGIWRLCRTMLILIFIVLLAAAAYQTKTSGPRIAATVLAAERGLELAIVGILLSAIAFCRYYRIRVEPLLKWIALGLGFYSAIQMANNSIFQSWLTTYFPAWSQIRLLSFQSVLAFWIVVLWRPLPSPLPASVLLDQQVYDELSPRVTGRLRELNTRLQEMLK